MSLLSSTTTQDLRAFLAAYRQRYGDDVLVIDEPVSPDQGVTAIVEELETNGQAPIVWCRNVENLGVEVVTNVFGSRARVARMLDAEPDHLHEAFQQAARNRCPPVDAGGGSVLELVRADEDVNVHDLPLLRHFRDDRAPYITSGVFTARDPDTGVGNLSYHRSMVIDRDRLSTSLHSHGHLWRALQRARERRQGLPVAIVIGAHPLFLLAAAARVGVDVDERDIAGGLLGAPLEVVRTPRHGLAVPAGAEIVLEGMLQSDEHAEEGPFGEFSGYSSDRSTNDVVHVQTVMRRRDPILFDICGGRASDHLNLARIPREAEMAERLKARYPDVVALHYPSSGTHFHAYVAVRQSTAGSARQVMLALLGWDPYLKTVVAVDPDIDLAQDSDVLWAVATRFQPHQDLFVISGLPGSLLDPSASTGGTTSRLAIDATRGPAFEAQRTQLDPGAVARAHSLLADVLGSSSSGGG